ncbi:MAG TPA: cation:proton antiporter [Gammaproteobacteria bacterium]|nr:cation:proton antiporter [Gammaproteobacteria bacterium]
MSNAGWFLLIGALLIAMGLTAAAIRRLPLTTAMVYLAVGLLIGPTVLYAFHFNPLKQSHVLEVVTELAVLLSLFSAGIKMPVPFTLAGWRTPLLLAFAAMALTVGLMAAFGHFVLGFPLGAAVLLGAILAPTDPVLATDVQVRRPGDTDSLRFGLTCEAGMNDGSAFPFVMLGLGLLGLHDLGDNGLRWALVDVAWATAAGIGIGIATGAALGRVVGTLRRWWGDLQLLDDFLSLGLIAVVYGISLMVEAWGFLAVFAAAVALRQTELRPAKARPEPHRLRNPAMKTEPEAEEPPRITDTTLVFKEQLERLSEVVLILLIGGTLFVNSWSWWAVGTALFLFLVARPVSVMLSLAPTRNPWRMRAMLGWFGVRGIGSLYYLMFAIEHGLPEELALQLIQVTLIVVTLSILVHGVSVKPLMRRFWSAAENPA